jgi:hypothetical protein
VCSEISNYTFDIPRVQQKVSYLDGQRGSKWKDLKEASKLNMAAAKAETQEEKQEIDREVKKIGYNFNKDPI